MYDEVDEKFYSGVEFGVLLVSEVYGVEAFTYATEQECNEGVASICREIEEADDGIDRDVALIRDGELRHAATWDGEAWEFKDLPEPTPAATV